MIGQHRLHRVWEVLVSISNYLFKAGPTLQETSLCLNWIFLRLLFMHRTLSLSALFNYLKRFFYFFTEEKLSLKGILGGKLFKIPLHTTELKHKYKELNNKKSPYLPKLTLYPLLPLMPMNGLWGRGEIWGKGRRWQEKLALTYLITLCQSLAHIPTIGKPLGRPGARAAI